MKIIKSVTQSIVFGHWEQVEHINISEGDRDDITFPLISYGNIQWSLVELERDDIELLFIISSDDWKDKGLCVPDFRLTTAIVNYSKNPQLVGKYEDIRAKEQLFLDNNPIVDKRLILVSESKTGPFTIIEGNKRAVALGKIEKLVGVDAYLGISPNIKNYWWVRYTYATI